MADVTKKSHKPLPVYKPTKEQLEELLGAAVRGVIDGVVHIDVKYPVTKKMPKGFPRGYIQRDTQFATMKVRPSRVLAWLNDVGYTTVSADMIRAYSGLVTRMAQDIERRIDEI